MKFFNFPNFLQDIYNIIDALDDVGIITKANNKYVIDENYDWIKYYYDSYIGVGNHQAIDKYYLANNQNHQFCATSLVNKRTLIKKVFNKYVDYFYDEMLGAKETDEE